MIIKYIRSPKKFKAELEYIGGMPHAYVNEFGGDLIGVVVSIDRNKVGWSLCNKKDRFNKERGLKIALNRAEYYGTNRNFLLEEAPNSIKNEIIEMYDRSEKYFK